MPVAKAPLKAMGPLGLTSTIPFKEVCKRDDFLAYERSETVKSFLHSPMNVLFAVARETNEICYLLNVGEIWFNEEEKACAKASEIT